MKRYAVHLGTLPVGHITASEEGKVSFRFLPTYRRLVHRPVLGQAFEDDLDKVYEGRRYGELPAYFANLVPEGPLRRLLEHSHDVSEGDDLALLSAVGHDLPGAVTVAASSEAGHVELGAPPPRKENGREARGSASEDPLRFSLAGVQMKFSVLNEDDRVTVPGRDELGQWIIKLDSTRFPNLVENEYATLDWAKHAGFDVPDCRLLPRASLPEPLKSYALPGSNVLAIKRYDRKEATRIHQEDFAQVVGFPPRLKYDQIKYEQLAVLTRAIVGEDAFREVIKRLVFMVASGNLDAHLKNWSLYYPDGIRPQLAPLYDQVVVVAWPGTVKREWALKLVEAKDPYQTRMDTFARLAERTDANPEETLRLVEETLDRVSEAWNYSKALAALPDHHAQRLREYWGRVPLLKSRVDALKR